jgi:hypothetical protein
MLKAVTLLLGALSIWQCGGKPHLLLDELERNALGDAASAVPDAQAIVPRRVCDGSDSMRLLYQVTGNLAQVEYGAQVVYQFGTRWLLLRGLPLLGVRHGNAEQASCAECGNQERHAQLQR